MPGWLEGKTVTSGRRTGAMIDQYTLSQIIEPCPPGARPDWIDLGDPDEADLAQVCQDSGLPAWFFTDPLDPRERPRVDQEGSALLIVVRLSARDPDAESPSLHTVPAGIIIGGNQVITVCRQAGLVRDHLSRLFQRRRHWNCIRLALALFHAAGTGFIDSLERLEELAEEAEARLRRSPENEELLALLNVEKALIDTTVALKSNHGLMEKFRQPDPFGLTLTKEERDLLDDAITENQQAVFTAEIFGQILASMGDAFGSLISNNLNKTMKFLAGVTIVLMLPTIIAGLYGMNVALPGAEAGSAFWALGLVCLGLMLTVCVLFAKKKWF